MPSNESTESQRDVDCYVIKQCVSASTSDGPATTDAALAALAAEAGLIDPVQEPSGGLSFMVATDDGAGGDGKVEDSCNGNEATAAAALVSQMGAGEPMQVDGDGNFVLPQVDGPTDILLSEDEENDKVDLNEDPAPENAVESAVEDESTPMEQDDVNAAESIHAEEPAVKEQETAPEATADLPEAAPVAVAADEAPEETETAVDNPPIDEEERPMDTSVDNTELPSEKEMDIGSPLTDEVKEVKSELPFVQSPAAQAPLEEEMPLTDVADSAEPEGTENQEEEQVEKEETKSESYLPDTRKSPALESLPVEDSASQLPQDETQEIEKIKDETAESEVDLPTEDSPVVKTEDADEPMITDSALPVTEADQAPVTTSPIVAPNVSTKLEPANEPMEPMEQDKFADLPISSINGVAASLNKEIESPQKVNTTPIKIDIKEDPVVVKRESLKQEKINDARPEIADDSTALSTLASAALSSTESVKVSRSEHASLVSILGNCLSLPSTRVLNSGCDTFCRTKTRRKIRSGTTWAS